MQTHRLFTSESVTEGHPDKLADQVSDAILDAVLDQDKHGRVAVETLFTFGHAIVAGEVTTTADVAVEKIVRDVVCSVGYNDPSTGFDGNTCSLSVHINRQSPDIACGVNIGGAGDQGMMFGYASNETAELMPLPITLAHEITSRLTSARKNNPGIGFRPDGKSQVTVAYIDGKPSHIDTIVISTQHEPGMTQDDIRQAVNEYVLNGLLDEYGCYVKDKIKMFINPTGIFEIGGPQGDTGLTGRKIIVDTYGGMARHGGGAFSGKDPTKVDRSAAYIARHVAKNIVSAGMAERCEIQLAYAIGIAEPVSVLVDTFGTGAIPEDEIMSAVKEYYDLTPKGIIESLDLLRPIYRDTAKNGHFGHPEFPWEFAGVLPSIKSKVY
ncbi:MAG: methionine adenosyltransferase [Armatimonadota bacterium]